MIPMQVTVDREGQVAIALAAESWLGSPSSPGLQPQKGMARVRVTMVWRSMTCGGETGTGAKSWKRSLAGALAITEMSQFRCLGKVGKVKEGRKEGESVDWQVRAAGKFGAIAQSDPRIGAQADAGRQRNPPSCDSPPVLASQRHAQASRRDSHIPKGVQPL